MKSSCSRTSKKLRQNCQVPTMSHTKVPKSHLKPPQIIVTGSSRMPLLQKTEPVRENNLESQSQRFPPSYNGRSIREPISETKINMPKPITSKAIPPLFPISQWRRRSKSVTDLRSLVETKPLTKLQTPALQSKTKSASTLKQPNKSEPVTNNDRVVTKRPAEKSSEGAKPKKARMKIPDWDYKSRFNLLNEKHLQLQQNFKEAKTKLSDLANIEEEFKTLKEEVLKLKTENQSLTEVKTIMANDIDNLKTKNQNLQSELSDVTSNYEKLQQKHHELVDEHEALLEKTKNVTEKLDVLGSQLDDLTKSNDQLVKENERLTSSNNLLQLEYDTKLRENDCLGSRLTEALERIERLKKETKKQKGDIISSEVLRRQLHNTIQDLKGNIRVFCRVRPPVTSDEFDKLQCYINYIDECTIEIRKSRGSVSISGRPNDFRLDFTFDHVFSPDSTQEEVFSELAQLIQSALDGYHVCVFAYGQTGSGKTFTMQGEPPDKLGMIPKSIDLIFETIEKLKSSGWQYKVEASFLEIYNETVKDLLEPNSKHTHDIRYNEGKGMTITNLRIEAIKSAEELKDLMNSAQRNRAVASTDFNEHSSRSHAVTKIYLQGSNSHICYSGSVNLVDLAGSESAKTSATDRLTETKNINKSLSTLGSVMLALHNKDPHVPYRNSKLTYLLQSCLGGNSKTLMFVNISPFEDCYNESVNSLRFASKVKEVKTGSKRNKNYVFNLPPVMTPAQ